MGIKATGSTGETVTVNAKAVVLTTGGFGANLDMVVEYKPELKGFMTTNAAGAQGQGIEMATAIGAGTVDMDQIQIHPTVEANTAALITEGLRGDGAVLINAEGKRFIDEVGTVTWSLLQRSHRPAATAGWWSIRLWSMLPASFRATSRRATP